MVHGDVTDAFVRREPEAPPSPKRPCQFRHIVVEHYSIQIIADPGLHVPISDNDQTSQENMRRQCLIRGPTQPTLRQYPKKLFGSQNRAFNSSYFKDPELKHWPEYSVKCDNLYCLFCYLFPSRSPIRNLN